MSHTPGPETKPPVASSESQPLIPAGTKIMASKSLLLTLAFGATTTGAVGLRGLNFGYRDTCVATDVEIENKCQDYSCKPGLPTTQVDAHGAPVNCGAACDDFESKCVGDEDCMWMPRPTDETAFYINHDYCMATEGEKPAVVDRKNMYFYPRAILDREYIQNEDIPGRPVEGEGPFNYYRLTVAMQCPDQSCDDLKMDNGVGDYFRVMTPSRTICEGDQTVLENCKGT